MTLITLILTFVVVGVFMWLINAYVPMEPNIKRLLNIAVVIILVLWLLSVFGIIGALDVPIRRVQ